MESVCFLQDLNAHLFGLTFWNGICHQYISVEPQLMELSTLISVMPTANRLIDLCICKDGIQPVRLIHKSVFIHKIALQTCFTAMILARWTRNHVMYGSNSHRM
jgi:hypothetical protein